MREFQNPRQYVARSKGAWISLSILNHSQDPKKNPLNQTTKIKYMKKMFPKYKEDITQVKVKLRF